MKTDPLRSLLARRLPRLTHRQHRDGWRAKLLKNLRSFYQKGRLPVRVFLHNRELCLNPGSPYPFVLAEHPHFNSGLVAAARALRAHLGRPLHVIDIGAAVGDTVALLLERVPSCFASCLCVDGAPDNRPLLEHNLKGVPNIRAHFTMLAAHTGEVSSLVRHHPGTAAATGEAKIASTTIDALTSNGETRMPCDLFKVDTDGFDGDILLGSVQLLIREQPLVIFEWHPELIHRCGNDPQAAFEALRSAGYGKLLWFKNTGPFSHSSDIPARTEITRWAEFLREKNHHDPHFDIIALPPSLESMQGAIMDGAVYP